MPPENKEETGRIPLHYIALFPHEDVARELRSIQKNLFGVGIAGARSIPPCAFLQERRASATRAELEKIAAELGTFRGNTGGFLTLSAPALADRILPVPIWGLSIALPTAISGTIETSVLALATLARGESQPELPKGIALPFQFRPAYVANVVLYLSGTSCEWEQGRPSWLPQREHAATLPSRSGAALP